MGQLQKSARELGGNVLGLDVGRRSVGWAVVKLLEGERCRVVEGGVVTVQRDQSIEAGATSKEWAQAIGRPITQQLGQVIQRHGPIHVACAVSPEGMHAHVADRGGMRLWGTVDAITAMACVPLLQVSRDVLHQAIEADEDSLVPALRKRIPGAWYIDMVRHLEAPTRQEKQSLYAVASILALQDSDDCRLVRRMTA